MNPQIRHSIDGIELAITNHKLIYALYLAIGTIFLIVGLITVYGIIARTSYGLNFDYKLTLFLCYTLLNFILAYGFILCKKWIMTVVGIHAVSMTVLYVYTLAIGENASSKIPGMIVFIVLLAITYIGRHLLTGLVFKKLPVIGFAAVALIVYIITNLNLV